MEIKDNITAIETLFEQWRETLGADYHAYKKHAYRVVNFCLALKQRKGIAREEAVEREKIVIAACFHDIGIWSNDTFDYLDPSIELAKTYVNNIDKTDWLREIELMIRYHHKVTPYRNGVYPLVEIFRKADWIDVTKGKISFNLAKSDVKVILDKFPNKGFHDKLVNLAKAEFKKKPLKPLPMMKW